jgi:hypothetical protein
VHARAFSNRRPSIIYRAVLFGLFRRLLRRLLLQEYVPPFLLLHIQDMEMGTSFFILDARAQGEQDIQYTHTPVSGISLQA